MNLTQEFRRMIEEQDYQGVGRFDLLQESWLQVGVACLQSLSDSAGRVTQLATLGQKQPFSSPDRSFSSFGGF